MTQLARNLNALMILILSLVLTGAYAVQFGWHETPCPLCMLQRLGMIGVVMGELLNLRFGIRVRHYAISYISAVFGASVSLRQIALHICPGSPTFGEPVLGLALYTWAFIVFVCVILGISALLFLYKPPKLPPEPVKTNWFQWVVFFYVFALTLANAITTVSNCGLTACQS